MSARTAFNAERFARVSATLQLSPQCLCCGKLLTDPASQARLIGPECAESSSLLVPWIVVADEDRLLLQGEQR